MGLEFRPGDILLFELRDEKDFLGKCIAILTDSNITHSAMIYENNKMVEAIGSGISLTPFHIGEKGYPIHAFRFTPEVDYTPLRKAADYYLKKKVRFDYVGLILLGGLLVFRKVTLTVTLLKPLYQVLLFSCKILNEIYHYITGSAGKKYMICSQLVYQCYQDCGPNYRIKIKNGIFQESGNVEGSLYDFIRPELQDALVTWEPPSDFKDSGSAVANDLMEELYAALSEVSCPGKNEIVSEEMLADNCSSILEKVKEFVTKLKTILDILKIRVPLPSLFVTPADLMNHAENLKQYGKAVIVLDDNK